MVSGNGTPPYTFYYYRHHAPYTYHFASLEDAVEYWTAGSNIEYLYGHYISDAAGEIVVTHDAWSDLFSSKKAKAILADPDWRDKYAERLRREEEESKERARESALRYEQQVAAWQQMIETASRQTGVPLSFSVSRSWIDTSDPDFASQVEGVRRHYAASEKEKYLLRVETTLQDILDFVGQLGVKESGS